jgi:dolichol-phosphate mannosyltransferase
MSEKKNVAVVVIPTYNEAKTVGNTLEYLCTKTFPGITDYDMQILVIDGNSPDGTALVVRNFEKKYPNVHLLLEKSKDGIGAGYLKAFKYGIEKLKADFIFEFDSDLQHPPETIPVMLEKMSEGYDYVIGSRKIKGGSSPKGWGFKRLFFSEVGGFVARTIMFFPFKNFFRVTDPTTGLKVTRVKGFLDKLDLDYNHLYTKSFGYKLELLYETLSLGAKFTEIPLKFQIRKSDESKIEPQTAKEILKVAILLRWLDPFTQKFLKFGVVGGIGFVINFGLFRFFKVVFKDLPYSISIINWFANALAAEVAIISNFTWNNLWTFAKEKITSTGQLIHKFITFNLSSVVTGIIIPSTFVSVLTYLLGDKWSSIYLIIGIFGITIPLNWILYNKVIWKKR